MGIKDVSSPSWDELQTRRLEWKKRKSHAAAVYWSDQWEEKDEAFRDLKQDDETRQFGKLVW